jgi:aspartate/methionine/tyrosine aminotransferase
MNNLTLAHRLQALQSNVFADMDRAKAASREAGNTIIDLSLGSSDPWCLLPMLSMLLSDIPLILTPTAIYSIMGRETSE